VKKERGGGKGRPYQEVPVNEPGLYSEKRKRKAVKPAHREGGPKNSSEMEQTERSRTKKENGPRR